MKTWLACVRDKSVEDAFEELKRLTSLAFGEEQDGEVIALVDECQSWANTLIPTVRIYSIKPSQLCLHGYGLGLGA